MDAGSQDFSEDHRACGSGRAGGRSRPRRSPSARRRRTPVRTMARGFVFATLRRPDGYGLGIRTERGILDVAAAEQEFRENAPTTIDAVFKGQGDAAGLRRLVEKANAAGRHFVAIDKATFGPCVTHPEKIVCIGLNYRKHAAETGNPVPKEPILFNKFNTALNHHGGTIPVVQGRQAVRLRGRAGDRDRASRRAT